MRQTPIGRMQARNNVLANFHTVVLHFAGNCTGLVGLCDPIDTGRERLGGHSALIGGADGKVGYYRVIYSIQIVPSLTQVFGRDMYVTSPGKCRSRSP